MKGLRIDVYRTAGQDCSLNGITSRHDVLTLVGVRREYGKTLDPLPSGMQVFEPTGSSPAVVLVTRDNFPPYLAPYDETGTYPHGVAGGQFAHTFDSRFYELTGQTSPISVHDRFER